LKSAAEELSGDPLEVFAIELVVKTVIKAISEGEYVGQNL
jgi:hypothetical protein